MTAAPSNPDLPLKQRLKNGHVPVGTMVFEFFVPGMAQMARAVGADFLMYDTEHSGVDIEAIKAQCAACNGTGVVPLVRVPGFHYHFVARALDAGAHGIMMPMVADAEQARALVSWSRYPPLGRRGAAFGVAHDGYLPGAPRDKIAASAERTLVIAMIETPEGVANVDAIAAVDGVDVLWIGHFDLTNFMGIAGEFDHPDYLAAVDRIVAAARRHGKTAAVMAGDEAWARRYHGLGFRMFAYGLDSQLFQRALAAGIGVVRALD